MQVVSPGSGIEGMVQGVIKEQFRVSMGAPFLCERCVVHSKQSC